MVETQLRELICEKYGSVKEFASRIGIPYTTLDSILKRGVAKANVINIIKICQALNIDAEKLGNGTIEEKQSYHNAQITTAELAHIKKYRTIDGHGKETVDVVLDKEVQRMEEMRKAEEKKVLKPKEAVIDLRRYWESPSAGNGNDLSDGGYDIIQVPDTLTARLASYALTVSGDSMEPDLMDGDIVLVKAQETYEVGDIVVFAKNGESYIKYAGEDCFESANPDYPDIVIGEDDCVRCFGVVLGKL